MYGATLVAYFAPRGKAPLQCGAYLYMFPGAGYALYDMHDKQLRAS